MTTIYRDIAEEIAKNEDEKGESEKDHASPRERISSFAKKNDNKKRDIGAIHERVIIGEYTSPQCDRLKINVARGRVCTRQINTILDLCTPSMSLNT